MGNRKYFKTGSSLKLKSGNSLQGVCIAYDIYGTLNASKSNVVWVCHALTADSDVRDWWPGTVEKGGFLDPDKWFVVCANILGSHYGSTGPLSINPATGEPYYDDFPQLTVADWVAAHQLLADHLGIGGIYALVGSSVGGFQAMEWIAEEPARFKKLILIATAPYATPWTIAIDETQRMAIFADGTYGERRPDAAQKGLAAARAIGLLTYRGGRGYNISQRDPESDTIPLTHRANTYQQYQGEKLVKRFDAYSYVSILNTFDTHDIGRNRGGYEKALSRIKADTITVGITTDIIFPPYEIQEWNRFIPSCTYREIKSPFGHDGFLVEHQQLNDILIPFMEAPLNKELNTIE
ncbi:MAG: homoserine O-acetyltransferase [Muribaculaceae bacterium]|nr:homoserine O-acetyltransferase [Muribaculaceae bacterium]